jgi:hypothetical protein
MIGGQVLGQSQEVLGGGGCEVVPQHLVASLGATIDRQDFLFVERKR